MAPRRAQAELIMQSDALVSIPVARTHELPEPDLTAALAG